MENNLKLATGAYCVKVLEHKPFSGLYLNELELGMIKCLCRGIISRGEKLLPGWKRYSIKVDGSWHYFVRIDSVLRFLSSCIVNRQDLQIFRNFGQGVTINLDRA